MNLYQHSRKMYFMCMGEIRRLVTQRKSATYQPVIEDLDYLLFVEYQEADMYFRVCYQSRRGNVNGLSKLFPTHLGVWVNVR